MTDRRTFLTAALAAPIAIAAPAIAAAPDPVDVYWRAQDDFNNHRISEKAFLKAVDRLEEWEPRNHRDFVRHVAALFDGGIPREKYMLKMAENALRLTGRGA
jgi:hypothetical protein